MKKKKLNLPPLGFSRNTSGQKMFQWDLNFPKQPHYRWILLRKICSDWDEFILKKLQLNHLSHLTTRSCSLSRDVMVLLLYFVDEDGAQVTTGGFFCQHLFHRLHSYKLLCHRIQMEGQYFSFFILNHNLRNHFLKTQL